MIITYIAWVFMFASWCVAYRTINSLKKELNRFKYNESHYKAVLRRIEDFFRTMVSCMAELEPIWYEKDPKYLDSLCERMGYNLVRKM